MFFVLSKILGYFLSPLFWILALLIIAFFIKKRKLLARRLFLISIIMFLFFSNRFISDEFMRRWEIEYTDTAKLASSYDVGIVLGGGIVTYDHLYKRNIFRMSSDRFLQALELYKTGRIKKMLFTGGPGNLIYKDQYEASFIKNYLINIGVPDSVILVDSLSDNTHQNAIYSKNILAKYYPNGGKYLLITSAKHMRRSLACYKKEGFDVDVYPTNKISGRRHYNIEYLFIPQLDSFQCWSDYLHEVVGYLTYKIMGYV
jgi:uncharacterized SAM-binding protein YcdF (DUF218 family)